MAERLSPSDSPSTAIVGAGLAGLVCARSLESAGLPVRLFDKARGPGGRMSTRRTEARGHTLTFDHGAQYFTVRDEGFRRQVESWAARGLAAPWRGALGTLEAGSVGELSGTAERWVGVPRMSALTRDLAQDLVAELQSPLQSPLEAPVARWGTRVARIARGVGGEGEGYLLVDPAGEDLGVYDRLVLAVPAPQAARLLATLPEPSEELSRLTTTAAAVSLAPCWAVLAAFSEPLDASLAPLLGALDGAFVHGSPLSWVARDSAKPGRETGGADCWVLHGSPEWSREHLEAEPEEIAPRLLEALAAALGLSRRQLPEPDLYLRAHRWRYALPDEPLEGDHLLADDGSLGLCGDWCGGPRVEGAWRSGRALGLALGGA